MAYEHFSKFLVSFLCFVFLMQSAFAQDVLDQSVSKNKVLSNKMDFASAISYSLQNNNNIRAMRKRLSATERDIGIARSDMLPHLRFNENFLATNSPVDALGIKLNQARVTTPDLALSTLNYPGANINFLTAGLLEQRILDVKNVIEIKIAKKEYSANGYTFMRKQEDLVNEVAHAYLKVMENQELIESLQKSITEEKVHVDIAKERLDKKTGIRSDYLRAEAALSEDEEKLIFFQRNQKIAKRNLGLLLGLEYEVETTDSFPTLDLKPEDYYKALSIYRNDIKAMEVRAANAKNCVKAAQAEWLPTLNAFGSYNFYNQHYPFGGEGNNYVAGANFKWELFDGNKRKYEILKAKDIEAEIKEHLIWLRKNVDFKVFEAYTKVEAYKKNLEISLVVLAESEEDTQRVRKRWENSELPFVSLIDAQNNLENVRFDVIKNEYDLKKAIITLIYETGIISQELGLG